MSTCIIGGIEGTFITHCQRPASYGLIPVIPNGSNQPGATHSNAVLINSAGKIIAAAKGPSTNHHLTGQVECRRRIAEMINKAKIDAGIPIEEPLEALGLSLSGCEQEESNQELVKGLAETYPNLSKKYAVASDTEGSVATTSNRGGITCIAGTGSNTLLINPDGTRVQCGGWGYLLGDEGSAWKIANRSIKYCFDDLDNFEEAPYPTHQVWQAVKEHFKIQSQADILDSFYTNFDKAYIASFCKKVAELADNGDKLCQHVFEEAGTHLAKSIAAVVVKADAELAEREGGIHVLCVGSVWLSWQLLKPGFVMWLRRNTDIRLMSLMKLTTTMGVGAAYMAADRCELELVRDYAKNYTVFFKYDRKAAFIS